MSEKFEKALEVMGLTTLLYSLAYFALVHRGATFQVAGFWSALPDYRGLPAVAEVCFRPLHNWDRTSLRPRIWEGRLTAAERAAQTRAIMELLGPPWNAP
jgi:hypothetical protein